MLVLNIIMFSDGWPKNVPRTNDPFHESRFEMHVNKFGRSYFPGKAIGDEFRRVIIERIIGGRGYGCTDCEGGGEIDALITFLCVDIWTRFCKEYLVTAYATGDSIQGKISNDDLELIKVLKTNFSLKCSELWKFVAKFKS